MVSVANNRFSDQALERIGYSRIHFARSLHARTDMRARHHLVDLPSRAGSSPGPGARPPHHPTRPHDSEGAPGAATTTVAAPVRARRSPRGRGPSRSGYRTRTCSSTVAAPRNRARPSDLEEHR